MVLMSRKCVCGKKMKQQFIGLEHCKCGMSYSRKSGYFERTSDMIFALERCYNKKGKSKQIPIIKYKSDETRKDYLK